MRKNYLKIILLILLSVVVVQAYYLYALNDEKSAIKEGGLSPDVKSLLLEPNLLSLDRFFNEKENPFIEIERLRREIESSFMNFDHFFQITPSLDSLSSKWHRVPRFDMKEQKGNYIITMEIPGADKSNIDIKTEKGRLMVSAKVSEEKDDNTTTYYRHERRTSSYRRDLLLPVDADEKSLKSEYNGGLLIITLTKKTAE